MCALFLSRSDKNELRCAVFAALTNARLPLRVRSADLRAMLDQHNSTSLYDVVY